MEIENKKQNKKHADLFDHLRELLEADIEDEVKIKLYNTLLNRTLDKKVSPITPTIQEIQPTQDPIQVIQKPVEEIPPEREPIQDSYDTTLEQELSKLFNIDDTGRIKRGKNYIPKSDIYKIIEYLSTTHTNGPRPAGTIYVLKTMKKKPALINLVKNIRERPSLINQKGSGRKIIKIKWTNF